MRVLAVDFGTSNTVAALAVDGGPPRLVNVDGSPLVPSSVYLTDDGTIVVGRDADRQARIDPSRYEPNPKRRIDESEVLLGDTVLSTTRVIAAVLGRVAGEVRRQLHAEPDEVRLTHPARWGQRRRDVLIAASMQAGLVRPGNEPILIPEPVAAATHFATVTGGGLGAGRALAVYDLGAGTFDVAIVRRAERGYDVLAEAGLPDLGGIDFDHAILDHIGTTHAGAVDAVEWQRILRPTDSASRRLARALMTDVRDAKEALSRYPHTDIALPAPFTDLHLTRTEFEQLIRPALGRSIDLLRQTIVGAGLDAAGLAGIYLVGGSSRVPLVARLIQEGLGVTPTTLDQPETSVATGALYLQAGPAEQAARGPRAIGGARPGYPTRPDPTRAPRPIPAGPGERGAAAASTGPDPGGQRGSRKKVLIGGAAIVVVGALAATLALTLGGGGSDKNAGTDTSPTTSASGTPRTASSSASPSVSASVSPSVSSSAGSSAPTSAGSPSGSSAPNATLDQAFTDPALRDYVRPTYSEIRTCTQGAGDLNLSAGLGGVALTTCAYKNGMSVLFTRISNAATVATYYQLFQTAPTSNGFQQTTKAKFGKSGEATLYSSDGETAGKGELLWKTPDKQVVGLVDGVNRFSLEQVRSFWKPRFGS